MSGKSQPGPQILEILSPESESWGEKCFVPREQPKRPREVEKVPGARSVCLRPSASANQILRTFRCLPEDSGSEWARQEFPCPQPRGAAPSELFVS